MEMEQSILSALGFTITIPSSYRFLERFNKVANGNPKLWNLARYLIELPLIEQRMLKYCPSKLSASAIYLAQKILLRSDASWSPTLAATTGYSDLELRACTKDMLILLGGIEKCTL